MHSLGTRGLRAALISALLLPAAAITAEVVSPVGAYAASHKVHSSVTASATLSVPASVSVGTSFQITGTGYDPSQTAWIQVTTSSSQGWMSASVDSSGNLSLDLTVYSAGTVTLQSSQGGVAMGSASTTAS